MSDLLSLARELDSLDPENIEPREFIAEQMRPLLGNRLQEFDDRYSALLIALPEHPEPARKIIRAMLVHTAQPASGPVVATPNEAPFEIQRGRPDSCAAVVVAIVEELAEDTDGNIPVRILIGGQRYLITEGLMTPAEITLTCRPAEPGEGLSAQEIEDLLKA